MEDLRKMMMEQITRGAFVRVPRLSQDEIDAYSRPRKRQAKKKYHFLSFDISDEEDDFFEVCYPPAKKSRRSKANVAIATKDDSIDLPVLASTNEEKSTRKRKDSDTQRKNSTSDAQRKNSTSDAQRKSSCSDTPAIKLKIKTRSVASDKSKSSSDKPKSATLELKPVITTEVKILKVPKEEEPTYSVPLNVLDLESCESKYPLENIKKTEPCSTTPPVPNNSKIGKIRIKTAAELGSTVRFIDDDIPITPHTTISTSGSNTSRKSVSNKNSSSSKSGSVVAKTDNANSQVRNSNIDVQLIGDLYAKLFNTKNQTKIRNVAQILQSIAENIKNNNERVQEITNNKDLTDAEKLRRRCLSFQDLKRKQEENEMKLKEKFESIIAIFDNNNFELLFQLLFLGILKILIVSVSYFYKKGTIFKRLITLLQQSLSNSKFNDERVFKLLRSKDFRDRCITLVQFIEKHCKTEFFSMLFLSDSDKNLIKTKNAVGTEPATEDRNASFHKYIKPEASNVQERESFLLNLLQESKAIDPVSPPTSNHHHQQQQQQQQQQNSWKTYAPASKRNGTTASSSVPAPSNPPKTNTTNANGLVNSFIFSDGQIKPYPNNHVINIQTTEPSSNVRTGRPQNDANSFLNRPASDGNHPIGSAYHMNTPYNTHMKVHQVNGLNGTHPLSTSNGNIENIQPGSYVNTNNNTKKVTKDNTWNNGQVNGLRSLLVNESPIDPNRHNNYSRFLDPYGTPNMNLNIASRGPASISMARNNVWMG